VNVKHIWDKHVAGSESIIKELQTMRKIYLPHMAKYQRRQGYIFTFERKLGFEILMVELCDCGPKLITIKIQGKR